MRLKTETKKIVNILVEQDGFIRGWSRGKISMENAQTISIEIQDEKFFEDFSGYRYVDGVLFEDLSLSLSKAKSEKIGELQRACQNDISNGFSHNFNGVNYWFSLDMEAQQNFSSSYQVMKDGIVPEIVWTVKVDGAYSRLAITIPMMEELAMAIMIHKTSKIAKFRDILSPLVADASSIEELRTIEW